MADWKMEKWKHIVGKKYIYDMDELRRHPSVPEVIEGPFDLVCFEFYHRLFLYNQNNPALTKEEYKKRKKDFDRTRKEVWMELDRLIKRLDCALEMTVNNTVYLITSHNKPRPVRLHQGYTIIRSDELKILFKHSMLYKAQREATQYVIDEWYNWGKSAGYIDSVSPIEFGKKEAEFHVRFSSEISDTENSVALLLIMLNSHKRKTRMNLIDIWGG